MASVNLASKYSGKIAEVYTKQSYIMGNTCKDYDFSGVKTVRVYTPVTVTPVDYVREGKERFGELREMGDVVQEMTLTQDKGYTLSVDRGNNADQMNIKGAARMLKMQIAEQVTPMIDKYAFATWAGKAGLYGLMNEALTKDNILERILKGGAAMDNALIPDGDRVLYLPVTYYDMLRQSGAILHLDGLGSKAISKGEVGMVADMRAVKVPDSYMGNVHFMITHTKSVMAPHKLATARVLTEQRGVDGSVLEGRDYFDAFVIGAKAEGVYAAIEAGERVAAPVASITAHRVSVSAQSGVAHYYTTDGSDPRYSISAKLYTSEVTTKEGDVFKVYGKATDKFPSAVTAVQDK